MEKKPEEPSRNYPPTLPLFNHPSAPLLSPESTISATVSGEGNLAIGLYNVQNFYSAAPSLSPPSLPSPYSLLDGYQLSGFMKPAAHTPLYAHSQTTLLRRVARLPFLRNTHFIGRVDYLKKLKHSLTTFNVTTIMQTVRGSGGIGKTQLAVEYAYSMYEQGYYQLVWWFPSDNIIRSYLGLANELAVPEDRDVDARIEATKQKLNQIKNWLLIFDDAPDYEAVRKYFPPCEGHVLVTSREINWANSITLKVFNRDESLDLLSQILERDRNSADFTNFSAGLADLLGNLPLGLAQAGKFIKETGITIEKYINYFKQKRTELWKKETAPEDYAYTIVVTLNMSFNIVRTLSKSIDLLLYCCAYLNGNNLPKYLLLEILKDELELDSGIGVLRRFSIIDIEVDNNSISMHQLTQAALQHNIQEDQRREILKLILKALVTIFPGENDTKVVSIQRRMELVPTLEIVLEYINHGGLFQGEDVASLLHNLGSANAELGNIRKAIEYYQKALDIRLKILTQDHLDTAMTQNKMGEMYLSLEDAETAVQYLERALITRKKILGDKHADVADSYNNVGYAYNKLNKQKEALDNLTYSLEVRRSLLGCYHRDVAESYSNLGYFYHDRGDLEKALGFYKKSLEICIKVQSEDNPDVARAHNNLGALYYDMGNYAQALEHHTQALSVREKIYKDESIETALSYNHLGLVHHALRLFEKAIEYHKKALVIRKNKFGDTNIEVAFSRFRLGLAYFECGNTSKALRFFEGAYPIFIQILGEQNANTSKAKEYITNCQQIIQENTSRDQNNDASRNTRLIDLV